MLSFFIIMLLKGMNHIITLMPVMESLIVSDLF
jgi:hypothetical protein